MATSTRTVNVEDITQQSRERLNDRVAAAESLAVAHNARADAEEEAKRRRKELESELAEIMKSLEQEHKAAFDAALKAGWSQRDLRAMGLALPTKPRSQRQRRKPTNRTAKSQNRDASAMSDESGSEVAKGAQTSDDSGVM